MAVTSGGAGAMRPVRGGNGGVAVTPGGRLAPAAPTIEVRVWGYLRATVATTSSDKSGYRRCLRAVEDWRWATARWQGHRLDRGWPGAAGGARGAELLACGGRGGGGGGRDDDGSFKREVEEDAAVTHRLTRDPSHSRVSPAAFHILFSICIITRCMGYHVCILGENGLKFENMKIHYL